MTRKKIIKNAKGEIFFPISFFFVLVFFLAAPAGAQEMIPVVANSVEANETLGTPVDEIISAMSSGGLSGFPDLSALKTAGKEIANEDSVALVSDASGSEPSAPKFNPGSLKDLELKGGLSSDPQINTDTPSVFRLAVKFFEQVVFKNDVEFAARPRFDAGMDISGSPTFDKDTAGYAIIKNGNQSVVVEFDHAYDELPVVTATLSLQQYKDSDVRALAEEVLFLSDVKYIITNVSKKGFEIMMDKKADSDIPFSWHALAVIDPTTSKKKGESLKGKLGSDSGSKSSEEKSSNTDNAATSANSAGSANASANQPSEASQPLIDLGATDGNAIN